MEKSDQTEQEGEDKMENEKIETQKKEFTYRGKTLEELKTLDVREFAKYLPARSRRTVLRNYNEIEKFVNKAKIKMKKSKPIKTHQRDILVVPQMVGMKIGIYTGNAFALTEIIPEMLGHVLGEFAFTRSKVKHGTAGIGATKGSKSQSKH